MDKAYILLIITQAIAAVGTVAAVRVDISWLKKTQEQQHDRISKLEDKVV